MEQRLISGIAPRVVLDTHIVLDLFVFQNSSVEELRQQLQTRQVHWIATQPIHDELQCVLQYPTIVPWLEKNQIAVPHLLATLQTQIDWQDVPPKAPMTCKDPDDQKFVDLAVAHQAQLWSRDRAVRALKKRLLARGVTLYA